MEIRPYCLTAKTYLFLQALLLGQCRQFSGSSRLLVLAYVGFTFGVIFFISHGHHKWRLGSSASTNFQDDSVIHQRRKWVYKDQGTRSSAQFWDYSDPVLVDMPWESIKTTAEAQSESGMADEEKDMSYGIVIDCGSSGSRVFVYCWPKHSGRNTELLKIRQVVRNGKPVVSKITPGVASFLNRPSQVKSYVKPLLDYASMHIPVEKHKETPLYVLCTAGMRMLTKRHQVSILEQIELTIEIHSNFQFYSSHAEVISGMTEGLYFWMGLNYALGNLHVINDSAGDPTSANRFYHPNTVGIIDMGGGSLQIAFEVDKDVKQNFSKQVLDVKLGCVDHSYDHRYNVFVGTFLHKGGNAVRQTYEQDLVLNFTGHNNTWAANEIIDPCLPVGFIQQVQVKRRGSGAQVTVSLWGSGNFNLCRERIESYLDKSDCGRYSHTCILNENQMPQLDYEKHEFFGSSEFFYCMDDVLQIGGIYDKNMYDAKAKEYCATAWSVTWQRFSNGYYKNADANRMKFQCFKSAWVSVVLHKGFNFPPTYQHLTTVKYINKSEIQWTLGAILYKTRYLPLHEIQLHSQVKYENKTGLFDTILSPFFLLAQSGIFLFACILITLIYLLILLIRFCIHTDKRKAATLRRVQSSMAYLVNEEV